MLEGTATDRDQMLFTIQHPKQHFTLYRATRQPVVVRAPDVVRYPVTPGRIGRYVAQCTAPYLTVEEVDALHERPDADPDPVPEYAAASASPGAELSDEDFFE